MSSAGVAVSRIRAEEPVVSPRYFHNAFDLNLDEAILVFLSVSGNMIPLRVFESDSIESVKLRIQSCNGFVVKNQKLICGGRELSRSNSLVRDYGVANGNVLHLVLKLSDLRAIRVRTVCGKELTFHVERNRDVAYVKKQLAKRAKGLVGDENEELVYEGEQLKDQQLIDEICKGNDAVIHLLVRKSASAKVRAKPVEKNFELSVDASEFTTSRKKRDPIAPDLVKTPVEKGILLDPVVVNPKLGVPPSVLDVIEKTYEGLESGNPPIRSSEGSGGAYLMQDSTGLEYVSVFKPIDEEPKAVNNPHGLPTSPDGEGLKKGTRVGQGAFREVAAYLLDHPRHGKRGINGEEVGFSGVPPTFLVNCLHQGFNHPTKDVTPKIGSLQKFVKNNGSCEDIGPGAFPMEEVHKISVLDIRLANADRHAGNILYSKDKESGKTVLIPIDHGYCLPESFEDCTFEWLYWPQASKPYSADTVDYINSLDAEDDIALLKSYGWDLPLEIARTLRISTMLLKKGVERGLTPFQIGSIMSRETLKKESVIEEIVQEAHDAVLLGTSEAAFLETVAHIMDRRLDEVSN